MKKLFQKSSCAQREYARIRPSLACGAVDLREVNFVLYMPALYIVNHGDAVDSVSNLVVWYSASSPKRAFKGCKEIKLSQRRYVALHVEESEWVGVVWGEIVFEESVFYEGEKVR